MIPFKRRLKSLFKDLSEIDKFDANYPTEEYQSPIIDAIMEQQMKINNLKNSIAQLPNGPTLDLLDNFIVDLTGTAHVPLTRLLDNADTLMGSKSLS
jgi:hypothetical protein